VKHVFYRIHMEKYSSLVLSVESSTQIFSLTQVCVCFILFLCSCEDRDAGIEGHHYSNEEDDEWK
jgi:hypothetical protein